MGKKIIKILIFLLLISSLILVVLCSIFGVSISLKSVDEIKKNREYKNNLIDSIKINNVDAVYDKNENIYYYTVSEKYENNSYILKLELDYGYKYKILGKNINIIKVDYSEPIDVIIYNDKYYYKTKIQLTNLSIISIESEDKITSDDTKSKLKYISFNNIENKFEFNSFINIRGKSSSLMPKKSYRVNFYDEKNADTKNIQLTNFYYGDSFILDSVYKDSSKIRNLLATELWNSISNDFSSVDINSEFVELFINNEYQGLYVLTEPINRTKLVLNKSTENDTSIIIKSNGKIIIDDNLDFNLIDKQTFLNQEIKYPNDENLYSKVWARFLPKICDYYDENVKMTDELIFNTFNAKNYVDIIIFNSFINNIDNRLVRNNYFYMKSLNSDEIYIQPWDMEYSFGLLYSEFEETLAVKSMEDYKYIYTIFNHPYAKEINKQIIDRYWELRKEILTKDYFDKLLDKYENELNKGAAKRDSELWYEYDVKEEIEEIRTWIHNRIDFFDEYVKGLENE